MNVPLQPVALRRRDRALGFTLIELLITLALLSIVMAISIPNLNTGRSQALAEARAFKAALNHARNEAISLARPVVICSSSDPGAASPACGGSWQTGWITFLDQNGDGAPAADEVISRQGALSPGVKMTAVPALSSVTFTRSGFTEDSGEFLFCALTDASAGRSVVLAASGRAMRVAGTKSC